MYSGTTFRKSFGGFIGVHQKINRKSRQCLTHLPGVGTGFPSILEILYFEGKNGPDGIKRKSPSVDEPWHYIDPSNPEDTQLLDIIKGHYDNLVDALKKQNSIRAAFEAAWVSHAITDGLTPAHHYPLSDKIEELWGRPKEERQSIVDKNIIKSRSPRELVSKNWQYWGNKGVFMTHISFELGVAASIKTTRYPKLIGTKEWLNKTNNKSIDEYFLDNLYEIYSYSMYESFWKSGWSAKLARQSRQQLIPKISATVLHAWYHAYRDAGL